MTYSAEISGNNPTCILFLIDQSGSMDEPWAGDTDLMKSKKLFEILNRLIDGLVDRCSKSKGIRDYFHIGVVAYGGIIRPAFGNELKEQYIAPISKIAENIIRHEYIIETKDDGVGGFAQIKTPFPVYVELKAEGGTPMCSAIDKAYQLLKERWIPSYPSCFPPVVMNITDGESTEKTDPFIHAQKLVELSTTDGNILLFNAHMSSKIGEEILYPDTDDLLSDIYAKKLFQMSSLLPPHMIQIAKNKGYSVGDNAKGFVFNGDAKAITEFFVIGSSSKNLR
jgi:hypothetical protein